MPEQTYHILLVSPDDEIRPFIQDVLSALDNTAVKICQKAIDALNLLPHLLFDLIIFNDAISDVTSIDSFVRNVRFKGSDAPIVLVSESVFFVIPAQAVIPYDNPNNLQADVSGFDMLTLTEPDFLTAVYSALNIDPRYLDPKNMPAYILTRLVEFNDISISEPLPVPPSNSGSIFVEPVNLRLDTAVPESVQVGYAFDLAAAVRQTSSPILNEPGLTQVDSGEFHVEWPSDQTAIRLTLEISAPDCEIEGPAQRRFKLFRDQDSPDFFFHLTPKKSGKLSIIVTVYQEIDWLGSARVSTTAVAQLAGQVTTLIISQTLSSDHYQRLHGNLVSAFSMDDLRTLCLTIGINPESVDGHLRTLDAFANGLILYCISHDKIEQLIQVCAEARDHLYWSLDKVPV